MIRLWLAAACLAAATGTAARAQMFGPDSKSCEKARSTVETVECTMARTAQWDRRLNQAYAALRKTADPGQRQPLVLAQRQWIQYRDANCRFYAAHDGTIHQILAAECERAMTQARALELEDAARP